MPLLAEKEHMDLVQNKCLDIFDRGEPADAMQICAQLMSVEGLPMHCPYHHFLLPAALLTAANIISGSERAKLESDLSKARERSKDIPGGICGLNGCCGAGVGAGIFSSVWRSTTPLSKGDWASGNRITARALASIGSVDGPRCCKRNCFLSLRAAIPAIADEIGIALGSTDIQCSFYANSRECKKNECPFYPKELSE